MLGVKSLEVLLIALHGKANAWYNKIALAEQQQPTKHMRTKTLLSQPIGQRFSVNTALRTI